MPNIDEALASIKDKALADIVAEFKGLLADAKKDSAALIKEVARQTEKALILQAEGKIDEDDVTTLLKKQKKIAQLAASTAKIAVLSRIQKLSYRMLDIAIDVLAKAL